MKVCTFYQISLILVILAASLTGACSFKIFADKPPKIAMRITASSDLNPDLQGRPSPLVVRIYALKSNDVFMNADFFSLYEQDESILGDTVIERKELEILPGQQITIEKREYSLDTRYIGVIAAYRDLDNAAWRASAETRPDETFYININLERLTLTMKKEDK